MAAIRRYQRDSFGPLLDCIDIHVKVSRAEAGSGIRRREGRSGSAPQDRPRRMV
jgi:predicted ATPase with chaperone activity